MTVMTPVGSGIRGSIYHSHSFDATMTHIPGWKIVMPSNPLDAYGLMLACLKDPNPTMFLKPKALLRIRGTEQIPGEPELTPAGEKQLKEMIDMPIFGTEAQKTWKARWPTGLTDYTVEIGKGKIVSRRRARHRRELRPHSPDRVQAADMLREEGISVEVIDLRTLWPYDWEMIYNSVYKTGRAVFVNEDTEVTNFGEHLIRRVTEDEKLFYRLESRPRLVAGAFTPGIGLADTLEMASAPQLNNIVDTIRASVSEQA